MVQVRRFAGLDGAITATINKEQTSAPGDNRTILMAPHHLHRVSIALEREYGPTWTSVASRFFSPHRDRRPILRDA